MVLPRSSALRGSLRSFSFKRAGTQARANLRGVGRRSYASEHGATKSSDIPWLIGSIVVTVPAAGWLWQQGPVKSDHGHGHESHEKEEPEEKEEAKDEEPKEESSDEGADSGKSDTSEDSSPDDKSPPAEKEGDEDAKNDTSGAENPLKGADEESKKGEGETEG